MYRATLRNLLSHKVRLALSGLAIVLGVAFVSGTMIFTDTLSRTFNSIFEETSADVNVAPATAFDADITGPGAAVPTMPESTVATVANVNGVAAAAGYVEANGVYVLDPKGTVVDTGGAPGIGVSWTDEESLSASRLTDGRAPDGVGEVALDAGTVEEAGYHLGDTVTVLTPGPRIQATLVGVFEFGDSGGLAGASLTAFDQPTAQRLLLKPGQFSGISIAAADGVTDAQVRDRVAAVLGDGYEVQTGEERASEQAAEFEDSLAFVKIFLLVFAGIALFVGTFIILNTFSMLVAQRTRELALLRALGARRTQVTRSVLAEALVLGLFGSTLGLLAGYGLAAGLRTLFSQFGLTLDNGLVFTGKTVLWSYLIGIVVTLLAAYLPARHAAGVAPVAAMREDRVGAQRSLRRRSILGAAFTIIGGGALLVGFGTDNADTAAMLVGVGALALILAAVALSPMLARPFVRIVGAALPRMWGRAGHLARENALRNPRRTAATASALMIGLALVGAFSIIGASTNASIDKLIDEGLGADYVVTATGHPFTPEIAERIRSVDGVAAVTQERVGVATFDGKQSMFSAVNPTSLDRTVHLDMIDGHVDGAFGSGLLVDEPTAERRGWTVGDTVETMLPNGTQVELRVGGIMTAEQPFASIVTSLDTYARGGAEALDRYVYVDVADNADAAAVHTELERQVAAYPVVSLKDQTGFKDELTGQVDQMLLLINALLALSVLIAVLGIVNTLALSVIERTREIGLLRAVGMSRRQLRRMVRLESVVIAVYGALLGLGLGSLFGVSLVQVLSGQGISVLAVPWERLGLFVVLAAGVGVLAALLPARRAARLPVLDAIATE